MTTRLKPRLLGWVLVALGLAAAAPLQVGRPYALQIEATPAGGHEPGRRPYVSATCQVARGPSPNATDRVFVESGCQAAGGQQLTRWDPARQRMVGAPDVQAKPPFVAPATLLGRRAWAPPEAFADGPGRSAASDYEVVLKSRGPGPQRSRVLVRSGAWERIETVDWRGSPSLTVQDREIGLSLSTWLNAETRVLAIRGPSPIFPPAAPFTPPRVPNQPDVQVLGETCSWWDLMPGVDDAGLWECRAADGVPLAQRHFGRGSLGDDIFAISVHRGRIPLSRVLPSKAEVSAGLFGLR